MYLVQILLPLFSDERREILQHVRGELTQRFGGLTTFSRAPAIGLWKDHESTELDDIVVYEIMVEMLDEAWWQSYRLHLQNALRQDVIVMRALPITVL